MKGLRYEIKNRTPPDAILRAMQARITAEREKRAVIATYEGKKQKEINLAKTNNTLIVTSHVSDVAGAGGLGDERAR